MNSFDFKGMDPYLMVLNYAESADEPVQEALQKYRRRVRSRRVTASGVELILEVKLKSEEAVEIDKFLEIEDVRDASIVSYSGDYAT